MHSHPKLGLRDWVVAAIVMWFLWLRRLPAAVADHCRDHGRVRGADRGRALFVFARSRRRVGAGMDGPTAQRLRPTRAFHAGIRARSSSCLSSRARSLSATQESTFSARRAMCGTRNGTCCFASSVRCSRCRALRPCKTDRSPRRSQTKSETAPVFGRDRSRRGRDALNGSAGHSTVTLLARLRGLSTSLPRSTAAW